MSSLFHLRYQFLPRLIISPCKSRWLITHLHVSLNTDRIMCCIKSKEPCHVLICERLGMQWLVTKHFTVQKWVRRVYWPSLRWIDRVCHFSFLFVNVEQIELSFSEGVGTVYQLLHFRGLLVVLEEHVPIAANVVNVRNKLRTPSVQLLYRLLRCIAKK